jgi:NADH-quinone oxidoreductase subunit M
MMFSSLSLLIFLPLMGAFVLLTISGSPERVIKNVRHVGLWTSLANFFLSLYVLFHFDMSCGDLQMVEKSAHTFFGVRYALGVDGISMIFLLLTTFLVVLTIFASWKHVQKNIKAHMFCVLVLESLVIGGFLAMDTFLFFVFFESLLIPMFFIIGFFGGPNRLRATFMFFLYTFFGSLGLFVALIYVYQATGSFEPEVIMAYTFTMKEQMWLFWGFFLAFAVKVPMFPVHTWLPDTYVEAPVSGSIILSGVLSTLGAYGLLRFVLPFFPEACSFYQPLVFVLSVVGVVYASFVAFAQSDMKRLVAYSSVAHMGIVTLGLFSARPAGLEGAIFQMVSHGLLSAGLFMAVGCLYDRLKTYKMSDFGDLATMMPLGATCVMILVLSAVGLPGTMGFVGEFLVFLGAFPIAPLWVALAVTSVVWSAMYFLNFYRTVFFGAEKSLNISDFSAREALTLLPIVGVILFFGIFPHVLLQTARPAVYGLLVTKGIERDVIQPAPLETGQSTVYQAQP